MKGKRSNYSPRNTFGDKMNFFHNQLKMQKKNVCGMLQEPVLNMFFNFILTFVA